MIESLIYPCAMESKLIINLSSLNDSQKDCLLKKGIMDAEQIVSILAIESAKPLFIQELALTVQQYQLLVEELKSLIPEPLFKELNRSVDTSKFGLGANLNRKI